MSNKSNIKLYMLTTIFLFLVSSTWLYIINETRVAVYICVFLISNLISSHIIEPKNRYQIVIDFIIIVSFVLIVRLEVLFFLST